MKFYSYEYLLRRNTALNKIHLIILCIIFVVLIFSLVRYYRNKRDTKYREFALISLFCMIFMGLLQVNKAIDLESTSKQSIAVLKSVEHIAKELDVDAKDVYINTTLMKGEPLISVKGSNISLVEE